MFESFKVLRKIELAVIMTLKSPLPRLLQKFSPCRCYNRYLIAFAILPSLLCGLFLINFSAHVTESHPILGKFLKQFFVVENRERQPPLESKTAKPFFAVL